MGGCSSKPKTTELRVAPDMQEDRFQDECLKNSSESEGTKIEAASKGNGSGQVQDSQDCTIQNSLVEHESQEDHGEFLLFKAQNTPALCLSPESKDGPESKDILVQELAANNAYDKNIPLHDKDKQKRDQALVPPGSYQIVKEPAESTLIQERPAAKVGIQQTEKVQTQERTLEVKETCPCSVNDSFEPLIEAVVQGVMVNGGETLELLSPPRMHKHSLELQPQDMFQGDDHEVKLDDSSGKQYVNGDGGIYEEVAPEDRDAGVKQREERLEEWTELVSEDKATSEVIKQAVGEQSGLLVKMDNNSADDPKAVVKSSGINTQEFPILSTNTGPNVMEQLSIEYSPLTFSTIAVTEGAYAHEEPMQVYDASLVHGKSDRPQVEPEIFGEPPVEFKAALGELQLASKDVLHVPVPNVVPVTTMLPKISEKSLSEFKAAPDGLPMVAKDALHVPVPDLSSMDTMLPTQSHLQLLDRASGGSECTLEHIENETPPSSWICGASPYIEVAKDNTEFQLEKSSSAVLLDDGELKGAISVTSCQATTPQVCFLDTIKANGSADLLCKHPQAEEIPERDIDEVLEKLASEFERQESLSHSTH